MQQIYASFEQDINDGHLQVYPVNDQQVQNANLLIDSLHTNALRTLDAMHLSIARLYSRDIAGERQYGYARCGVKI